MPDTDSAATAATLDPLASISASQPLSSIDPLTAAAYQQQAPPVSQQPAPQDQPQDQFQTTPASQDPEVVAGHAHQSWLGRIMDSATSLLAGDTTVHVTKHPDGSVEVTHDPSTGSEKWGRIAAAALGGAAKGFAAGQGPGGAARAVGAGFDQGVQQRQQAQQQAEHEQDESQKQMLFKANMAHLNQQIVRGAWDNDHLPEQYRQQQQDYAIKHLKEMDELGIQPIMSGVKDPKVLAQYGIANPTAVGAHMGQDGAMIYNEPDGKGGVNIFQLSADQGNQRIPTAEDVPTYSIDPKDGTKSVEGKVTLPAGQRMKDRSAARMAITVANDNVFKTVQQAKTDAEKADTQKKDLELKTKLQPYEIQDKQATAANQYSEAAMHKAQLKILQGGAAAAGASGLHGDAFLQASGIDQSAWNLIRSTANGDIKMPTMNRSPQNVAFRQAVMNYDPTFTDARYDTKLNFKTKGDATSVMQLSTALAHAQNALKNSAVLGDSPSLATGTNLSGAASAYNSDANFFTGEQGKLVMGGIVGEKEAERIRQQISSPIQSIRDSGLKEVLRLTGGKVGALFQKYKTGAQQDLPVKEFFDEPTQQLLNRYAVTPQGAQDNNNPPSTFTRAVTQPPNPPYAGAVYGTGAKGTGWYPPAEAGGK